MLSGHSTYHLRPMHIIRSCQWHISTLARDNRVTVLTLGGQSKITTPDTIHLPRTGQGSDGRDPIDIPTDPESLTIFHRILSRVYKS